MANIKITDLTAYAAPRTTDVIPIVDVTTDTTKKVAVGEVVGKITGDVDVATDGTSSIAAGAIVNADVNASAAIAGTKIAPNFGSQTIETTGAISSGRLLVGTSSWSGNNSRLVCAGNVGDASGAGLITAARGDVSANLSLDSEVGRYVFTDLNGGEFARIACLVDGTPGATNDYPGRLVFSTTADGASSPTERWEINSNGTLVSLGPNIDNAATYTSTTANSANMYVGAGGIYQRSTSSIKYKTDIETLQDKYADAVLECRPVWYRSTCESDCAEHSWWGFIAEEVAEIDPRLVHWKTTESTIQEDGRLVKTPCNPEPDGVAYDRFVPHLLNLIKRQKEQIEAMEARLSAAGI